MTPVLAYQRAGNKMSEDNEAKGIQLLTFTYDPALQRSPEWLARKRGKIGASRMSDWLSVSKAKTGAGKPLKARLDYEKELMFERQFGVSFQIFVNDAMQDGIDYEDFARQQFIQACPQFSAAEVGCWYNDYVAVSPDRLLFPAGSNNIDFENSVALLEIKIVKDNVFTEILSSEVPDKHMKQIQAQLWATDLDKGYYCAMNFNTKRFVIIEVDRDNEAIEYMNVAVQEQLVVEPFALDKVFEIKGELPNGIVMGSDIDRSDSNVITKGWS